MDDYLNAAGTTVAISGFSTTNYNVGGSGQIVDGKHNTGLTWDEYLQTPAGQEIAMQVKMISAIAYLIDDPADMPYLATSGVGQQKDNTVAPFWYIRHGSSDSDGPGALEVMLYYALYNHDSVKDLNFNFAWRKGHSDLMGYENVEAWAWIDDVLNTVVTTDVTASVEKLNGNKNNLTITIADILYNGKVVLYSVTISIENNASGIYTVGPYNVYVDTKGNTQVRACYIVE
jgi:acyl-CoA-binding protein